MVTISENNGVARSLVDSSLALQHREPQPDNKPATGGEVVASPDRAQARSGRNKPRKSKSKALNKALALQGSVLDMRDQLLGEIDCLHEILDDAKESVGEKSCLESPKEEERYPGSHVTLKEDECIYFNPWSVDLSYKRKTAVRRVGGGKVRVEGLFKWHPDSPDWFASYRVPVWNGRGYRKSTHCGTIVVARKGEEAPEHYSGYDNLTLEGRLRTVALGVLDRYPNHIGLDMSRIRSMIRATYLKMYPSYNGLESDILTLVRSPWMTDQVNAIEGCLKEHQKSRHLAYIKYLMRKGKLQVPGGDVEKYLARRVKKRKFMWYGVNALITAGIGCLSYLVARKTDSTVGGIASAGLAGCAGFSAYRTIKGPAWEQSFGVYDFVPTDFELEETCRLRSLVTASQPFSFIPASQSYFRLISTSKELASPRRDAELEAPYTESDEKEEKVAVWGSTALNAEVAVPDTRDPHNIRHAIQNRLCFPRVLNENTTKDYLRFTLKWIEEMPEFDLKYVSDSDILAYLKKGWPAKKAKRMFKLWKDRGVIDSISKVSNFGKKEAYVGKNQDTLKPRPISSPPEEMIAGLGPYMVQIPDVLKDQYFKDIGFHSVNGYTSVELGNLAEKLWAKHGKCGEGDGSNFDGSFIKEDWEIVKAFVSKLSFPTELREAIKDKVGKITIRNKEVGIVLANAVAMCSGHPWTYSFDCLINFAKQKYVMSRSKVSDFDMIVSGDDGVSFFTGSVDHAGSIGIYKDLGMKYDWIPRDTIDEVTFCSGYFCRVDGGLRYGLKPMRILSKFVVNHNNHHIDNMQRLIYGSAMSMLPMAGHVPILGAVLRAITKSGRQKNLKPLKDNRGENPYRFSGGVVSYPDQDTYDQFANLYSVPSSALQEIDSYLEENLELHDFPLLFTDEMFKEWFDIDIGAETQGFNDTLLTYNQSVYHLLTVTDPAFEERRKVYDSTGNRRSLYDMLEVARMLGESENAAGATNHVFLHQLFGCVSMLSFPVGVKLHQLYNRIALASGAFPCSKNYANKSKKQLIQEIKSLKGQIKKSSNNQLSDKTTIAMLADPCHASLEPGFHSTDEGILSRLKTEFSPSSTFTNGFVVWDPTYASDGTNVFNAFFFSTSAVGTAPVNSVPTPFGTGGNSGDTQGISGARGAAAFNSGPVVADMRCVGACIRLSYHGRMDAASGQIAYLVNLPIETLVDASGAIASVEELFTLSSTVERLGLETQEIRWRPTPASHYFKTERDGVATVVSSGITGLTSEALRFGPKLIGFAWKNVPTTADLTIQYIQNIEWRPNVAQGFVAQPPKQIRNEGYIERLLRYLDSTRPGWQSAAMKGTANLAFNVARMAYTGTFPRQSTIKYYN